MRLPRSARELTRRAIGLGDARPITATELQAIARVEDVLVVGVGMFSAGSIDPRLPGEQRAASLRSLGNVVGDVPRQHAIVLHCG